MKIIDTHAHYDLEQYNEDRESLLSELFDEGTVGIIINSCADYDTIPKTVELAKKYPNIYMSVGVHPENVDKLENPEAFEFVRKTIQSEKCVAVGEIGLDYYWDKDKKELMQKWFRAQLELAEEIGKPVVIHSRDAAEDTLKIISEYYPKRNEKGYREKPGVIHCFSYSPEIAAEFIKRGFKLGIGGVITFENAKTIRRVVEEISLEDIVLETDCPYLAPKPFRGKRNNSGLLTYVAEKIAEIKGVSAEEVIEKTSANAIELYGLYMREA